MYSSFSRFTRLIAVMVVAGLYGGLAHGASVHSADQNEDGHISLGELLRVVQFFNTGGYHCAETADATEDGYAPHGNPAAEDCEAHDSDYMPQDWRINLSEVLRLIQFFNAGAYYAVGGTEDGFSPEPDVNQPCLVDCETEGEEPIEGEAVPAGEGQTEGEVLPEGEGQTEGEGVSEGEVLPEGEGQAEGEGEGEGSPEGAQEGEGDEEGESLINVSYIDFCKHFFILSTQIWLDHDTRHLFSTISNGYGDHNGIVAMILQGHGAIYYKGNGIPDGHSDLLLLQTILRDPDFDNGVLTHDEVAHAWRHNMARFKSAYMGPAMAANIHVIFSELAEVMVGYITLGDGDWILHEGDWRIGEGSFGFAAALWAYLDWLVIHPFIGSHLNALLVKEDFITVPALTAAGDANGNGLSNLETYQLFPGLPCGSMEGSSAYVAAALGDFTPDDPEGEDPDAGAIFIKACSIVGSMWGSNYVGDLDNVNSPLYPETADLNGAISIEFGNFPHIEITASGNGIQDAGAELALIQAILADPDFDNGILRHDEVAAAWTQAMETLRQDYVGPRFAPVVELMWPLYLEFIALYSLLGEGTLDTHTETEVSGKGSFGVAASFLVLLDETFYYIFGQRLDKTVLEKSNFQSFPALRVDGDADGDGLDNLGEFEIYGPVSCIDGMPAISYMNAALDPALNGSSEGEVEAEGE